MRLQPLFEDDCWKVWIEWTRPQAYEQVRRDGSERDDDAYLYYISARFSTNQPKVLYIGKTYDQFVNTRLTQRDHQTRYAAFVRNYPRHRFFISHGIVSMKDGKVTRRRIADVERILIHVNAPEHSHNIQHIFQHGVKDSYLITNTGYRSGLPRHIYLGVFVDY